MMASALTLPPGYHWATTVRLTTLRHVALDGADRSLCGVARMRFITPNADDPVCPRCKVRLDGSEAGRRVTRRAVRHARQHEVQDRGPLTDGG